MGTAITQTLKIMSKPSYQLSAFLFTQKKSLSDSSWVYSSFSHQ